MIEAAVLFRIINWNQVKKDQRKNTHTYQQQQHQSKDIEWMNKRKLYILQTNLKNLYVENTKKNLFFFFVDEFNSFGKL